MRLLYYVAITLLTGSFFMPSTMAQLPPLQLDDEHFETLGVALPLWEITVADDQPPQIDVGRYSSLAIPTQGDQCGIPRIAYYNENCYSGGALKYGWWYVAGSLWRHRMLDYSADVGRGCSLACWPDASSMVVTYFDDANLDVKAAIFDGSDWGTEILYDDWDGCGETTSVKFLPSGGWVAAFHGRTGWPTNLPQWGLLYRHANGDVTVVDTGRWAGFRCSLAIFPPDHPTLPGQPAVAFTEGDWGALNYAWSDDDGYNWHVESVIYDDDMGWHVSLVVFPMNHPDPELRGQPAIAHRDGSEGALRLTWRRAGSGWHTTVVDNDGDAGTFPSLAILPSGHPAISYTKNGPNGEDDPQALRYVRHVGPNFDFTDGWNPPNTVDDGGVGSYTSLAIGPRGNAAISYYDKTNGNLKYARQSLCIAHEH